MSKILIALQFWKGDRDMAMKLARLMADLEPKHSDDADVLFISRFDTMQDVDAVKYVSRKV